MFYCTNLNETELGSLRSRKVENAGQTYADFKMQFPLQVEYISMHPHDPADYFSMASISPDHHYYASLTKSELGGQLSKIQLHHHAYYELLFILSGNVYQIIENRRHLYTPGSCCLLNKNVLHAEEHETDFEAAFLGISDEVLSDVYKDLSEGFFEIEKKRPLTDVDRFLNENLSENEAGYEKKYIDFIPAGDPERIRRQVYGIFQQICDELLHPRIGSSHIIRALIAKLLHVLSDPESYATKPIRIGTDAENLLYNQIDRIMYDTCGRASRSFLESELHYSGDYLNKITKKYTGLSIHDFGMTICMDIAAQRLLNTKDSIGDIALSLGFSNRTHFYKQFEKIYHMSPAAYRRAFRES